MGVLGQYDAVCSWFRSCDKAISGDSPMVRCVATIDWQFTSQQARVTLKKRYPGVKTQRD
jgi:hypothetical protein